jgi:hypothetical protein
MTSHSHHSPTLVGRPVWKRILRSIESLRKLVVRDLGARYRRVFHGNRFSIQDWQHLQHETLGALLRGCATDLRTALLRMECRFDVLPQSWTYDIGPCFERDSSGNLQPNRDSDACMTDIERFQKERPRATLFDAELFHAGWIAGVQYARRTICTEDTARKSCKSPDAKSTPLRAGQMGGLNG